LKVIECVDEKRNSACELNQKKVNRNGGGKQGETIDDDTDKDGTKRKEKRKQGEH
jgi:hypothetical protein